MHDFCRNLNNCIPCRNQEKFREMLARRSNLSIDFECPRGIKIGTSEADMPEEVKKMIRRQRDLQEKRRGLLLEAEESLSYLTETYPEEAHRFLRLREAFLPQATVESLKSPKTCMHSSGVVGKTKEKCCGGRIKEVDLFQCEKLHKGVTEKTCRKCPHYMKEGKRSATKKTNILMRTGGGIESALLLAYVMRSLHETYPDRYLTSVRSAHSQVFSGNRYISEMTPDDVEIDITYNDSTVPNSDPCNIFQRAVLDLSSRLRLPINYSIPSNTIGLTEEEKEANNLLRLDPRLSGRYWVLDPSYESGSAFRWSGSAFREVVESFRDETFVLIRPKDRREDGIEAENIVNLGGQLDLRQMFQLVYRCRGTISLPGYLPLLSLLVGTEGDSYRPSIVLGGGLFAPQSYSFFNCHYLHCVGSLDCCKNGACLDGQNCGEIPSKCLGMVSTGEVIEILRRYL